MRRALPFLIVPCLLLAAACATKVSNVQVNRDFEPATLEDGVIAIGGFVASTRLGFGYPTSPGSPPPDDFLAQSDTWSPLLYGAFLTGAPQLTVWPWSTTRGAFGDSSLVQTLAVVARGGLLHPDRVQPLAKALPGARYLAVARLDGNEVTIHEQEGGVTRNQRDHDGRALHADDGLPGITTRRRVTMVLEIYDLESGRSLWAATVEQQAKELYQPPEQESVAADSLRSGAPYITASGTPRHGPPLEGVLSAACQAFVEQLLGEESESEN